jgi:type IV secretory pathway TrbF-like protein
MRRLPFTSPTLVSLLRLVLASPAFTLKGAENNRQGAEYGSSDFWMKLVISVGLVLAGGVFAGLVWISHNRYVHPLRKHIQVNPWSYGSG